MLGALLVKLSLRSLGLLALTCLPLLAGCGGANAVASAPHPLLGRSAELAIPDDRGNLGAFPDPAASATVVDFFGPTCVPCRKSVPELYARKAELQAMGVSLVLVAVLGDSESTDEARQALASWGVPGVSFLVDSGKASSRDLYVSGLPRILVFDAASRVRWASPDEVSADAVVEAARQAAVR